MNPAPSRTGIPRSEWDAIDDHEREQPGTEVHWRWILEAASHVNGDRNTAP